MLYKKIFFKTVAVKNKLFLRSNLYMTEEITFLTFF